MRDPNPMNTNAIELVRGATGWYATYSGPHAADVLALFGTRLLPTAFGPDAPIDAVLTRITALNPGTVVTVR